MQTERAQTSNAATPAGFRVHSAHAGLADGERDDFVVIASEVPATVSAMFTQSRFAGPSVILSRAAAADHSARGVVVLATNANVATGAGGLADAVEVRRIVAETIGAGEDELLIASTGVIGRRYPMERVRRALASMRWPFPDADFGRAARAIMTTDTRPKQVTVRMGDATLVGIAKGVGMIEPNMATLLAYFCTDAALPDGQLDAIFRPIVDRTFNALSIDTDTSTSDVAAVFANGLAGPVPPAQFAAALHEAALHLVREIAGDGEGASTVIEVRVTGARDDAQAKRVAKAIVNSPLVKTMVYGADPNWGRVAMAIGKCEDDHDIDQHRVRIGFADVQVYPNEPGPDAMAGVAQHLAEDEVVIWADLGIADGAYTVYGCDLTEGYVRLNSAYTT